MVHLKVFKFLWFILLVLRELLDILFLVRKCFHAYDFSVIGFSLESNLFARECFPLNLATNPEILENFQFSYTGTFKQNSI